MNIYLLLAASLAFLVGLIHSILGEALIFRRLRSGLTITTIPSGLSERHVRILWASWHIVTVFGWALGAILLKLSFTAYCDEFVGFVYDTIVISMLVASIMVLILTKAKHPGWIGLLGVAVLVLIS